MPGLLLDHARGDVQGGEALGAGAAQDAKHVVLLQGDAVRLDHARQRGADAVGRAEQRHDRLVGGRAKGLVCLISSRIDPMLADRIRPIT